LALAPSGSLTIERTRISGVTGAALDLSGVTVMDNCLIVDNPSPATGVLIQSSADLQMRYSTVSGNGTGLDALSASVRIEHSILCGNGTDVSGVPCPDIAFSDICDTDCSGLGDLDCNGVEGNISADPLFVDPGIGDYRLPISSPAVDAGMGTECFNGTPCHDFEDRPRLLDADGDGRAHPDMGAYELDHPSSVLPEPGDVLDLRVSFVPGTGHVLDWTPEPSATGYHVYDGNLASLGSGYSLTCLTTATEPPFTLPASNPVPGEVFVYAVSGDDGNAEGTLGLGACAERDNTFDSCP